MAQMRLLIIRKLVKIPATVYALRWLTDFVSIRTPVIERLSRRLSPTFKAEKDRCSAGHKSLHYSS
jgi:hypothetical protein